MRDENDLIKVFVDNNRKILRQPHSPFLWGTAFIIFCSIDFTKFTSAFEFPLAVVGLFFIVDRVFTLLTNRNYRVEGATFLQKLIDNIFMLLIILGMFFTLVLLSIGSWEYVYSAWIITVGLGYVISGWIMESRLTSGVGFLAVLLAFTLVLIHKKIGMDNFVSYSRLGGLFSIGLGSYLIGISFLRERVNG